VAFTAVAAAYGALEAPGGPMAPDGQDAPTALIAEISPAAALAGQAPEPLADPILDLRIPAGTAAAYRVRAGDYIQIIDVDGRQCSDFLAFHADDLRAGVESGIDPTTTRTLTGTANPGPGLHSRYFDSRQRPLVEIVQDTVGRHDTFMLACSARYYEGMGYPGHPNCSDNFNRALASHGVPPRSSALQMIRICPVSPSAPYLIEFVASSWIARVTISAARGESAMSGPSTWH
jgi:aminomethyltransferase